MPLLKSSHPNFLQINLKTKKCFRLSLFLILFSLKQDAAACQCAYAGVFAARLFNNHSAEVNKVWLVVDYFRRLLLAYSVLPSSQRGHAMQRTQPECCSLIGGPLEGLVKGQPESKALFLH